jgi:hypothetical protein
MPKPIVIVKLNHRVLIEGRITGIVEVQDILSNQMPDYYVIAVPTHENYTDEPIRFEVFYDKDFTEAKYEEIKSHIQELMKDA